MREGGGQTIRKDPCLPGLSGNGNATSDDDLGSSTVQQVGLLMSETILIGQGM